MATKTLKTGSKMPNFSLKGIDGEVYNEKKLEGMRGVIIAFTCNHCPYVKAYENRLKEIAKTYENKGVTLLAISSNDAVKYPEDSFNEMKKRGEEKNFNFPYLYDETQEVAIDFGATHTPEVFLFNAEKKLVYHGKIDDNWQEPEKVKNKYLKAAIDEMLNGEDISVPETFSIGCTIKWKEGN
jgi:peroxiredoxin